MSARKSLSGWPQAFTAKVARRQGRLFVVSGPSGCGKTTLCGMLLARDPGLVDSVSVTTRKKRSGEKNGEDYIFVQRGVFKSRIKKRGFLEHAKVFGEYYGTPKNIVIETIKKGRDVVLTIDVQGASQVKKAYKKAVLIFIVPPTIGDLKKRLLKRASETPAQMRNRLNVAQKELRAGSMYDYAIINDDMERAANELASIVAAERCRIN